MCGDIRQESVWCWNRLLWVWEVFMGATHIKRSHYTMNQTVWSQMVRTGSINLCLCDTGQYGSTAETCPKYPGKTSFPQCMESRMSTESNSRKKTGSGGGSGSPLWLGWGEKTIGVTFTIPWTVTFHLHLRLSALFTINPRFYLFKMNP